MSLATMEYGITYYYRRAVEILFLAPRQRSRWVRRDRSCCSIHVHTIHNLTQPMVNVSPPPTFSRPHRPESTNHTSSPHRGAACARSNAYHTSPGSMHSACVGAAVLLPNAVCFQRPRYLTVLFNTLSVYQTCAFSRICFRRKIVA